MSMTLEDWVFGLFFLRIESFEFRFEESNMTLERFVMRLDEAYLNQNDRKIGMARILDISKDRKWPSVPVTARVSVFLGLFA